MGPLLAYLSNIEASVARMVEDKGPDTYSKYGRVLSNKAAWADLGFKSITQASE